jgi:phosphomannomutase/phosphoglucomutase
MTASASLSPSIFKAYDIRGIADGDAQNVTLTEATVRAVGAALGRRAQAAGIQAMVVGRDGRLSGPRLVDALVHGLNAVGVTAIDLGMVPTPLVYFATVLTQCGSGVAVTGSHNPPQYNGLKMMVGGVTLYGEAIGQLYRDAQDPGLMAQLDQPVTRRVATLDVRTPYLERVCSDITLARPLKIAIDCGNGVAGAIAPALFRALGCEVIELFTEVDGRFPNHHPDPAHPENLQDLIACVQQQRCALGLAFDGDGDRLGVVTPSGQIIWPDRQLMLYAQDVLATRPGAQIIYDVKCTRHLDAWVRQHGGVPLMWRTGHSLIKAKLKETGAPLAGEMSGHVFFNDRWFGFDDGLYTGARLLEIVSRSANPAAVLESLPNAQATPELHIPTAEGENVKVIGALQQHGQFPGATAVVTIDGVRVEYPDGFGLARASNTTPVVVTRFEADTPTALARIQAAFRAQVLAVAPTLTLPF